MAFLQNTLEIHRHGTSVSRDEFEKALLESEDSESLNASFIERLNLTLRSSYANFIDICSSALSLLLSQALQTYTMQSKQQLAPRAGFLF